MTFVTQRNLNVINYLICNRNLKKNYCIYVIQLLKKNWYAIK